MPPAPENRPAPTRGRAGVRGAGACLLTAWLGGCTGSPRSPSGVDALRPAGLDAPTSPARPPGRDEAAAAALLDDVVDPWSFPHAAGASARERAIEDIGPYEKPAGGGAPLSTNGHYWTTLVGLPFARDAVLDVRAEPVDLDGDGRPDTRVTRQLRLPGGILAHPEVFGLVPTPDDPRGKPGRISASTGVLGLREALDETGRPTGQIGMTCWLCHAAAQPGAPGGVAYGLPNTRLDYGLLLATARVLDDGGADAVARAAAGFPPGRLVRARLLLAGPGRQDLTGEFGLDVTVPGTHSFRYPGAARLRQGWKGVTNPISVPGLTAWPGLALQNWSGSEDAETPWLERLVALVRQPEAEVIARFGLGPPGAAAGSPIDRGLARRTLMLDLRSLGPLGLQQDAVAGLVWADAVRGRAALPPEAMARVPAMFAARDVRALVAGSTFARPAADAARVARGHALFFDRVVGEIANRQVLMHVPRAYAAARLGPPLLAPLDPDQALEARLPVRCADCHNATPTARVVDMPQGVPPFRCAHCHVQVPPHPDAQGAAGMTGFRHPDVPAVAWSSSRLLPFDVDGDGVAQDDEGDDGRAGGIGTEALLAFDVPRPERPFTLELPLLPDARRAGTTRTVRSGAAWVRVAPLVAVGATAPYLHNGSVPTLRALLEPAARRPVTFELGHGPGRFVFDTRLAGNRNLGHEFGTHLGAAEKDDLVAFLMTL